MLGLRPDANTQWKRKPSPKPSSSDSSCAGATSTTMSEAASDSANAEHNFRRFMEAPFEMPANDVKRWSAVEAILHGNALLLPHSLRAHSCAPQPLRLTSASVLCS